METMRLTYRQKAFLGVLMDMVRHSPEPVHYTEIAKRVGITSTTAYDMLRVMEQKGYVVSQYAMPKGDRRRGRASVLFLPSLKGIEAFRELALDWGDDEEWEILRSHTLRNIAKGRTLGYGEDILAVVSEMYRKQEGKPKSKRENDDDLKELKARFLKNIDKNRRPVYKEIMRRLSAIYPEGSASLQHCSEVIMIILFCCAEVGYKFDVRSKVWNFLQGPANKLTLASLTGVALGLCLAHERGRRLLDAFEEYNETYQESLQKLDRSEVSRLRDFALDVSDLLNKMPSSPGTETHSSTTKHSKK